MVGEYKNKHNVLCGSSPPAMPLCFCFAILILFLYPSSSSIHALELEAAPSCPIDFQYLHLFPSALDSCQNDLQSDTCCQALLNTFGIGIAQYLRDTGFFELPDNATVDSCLNSYHSSLQLNGFSLPSFDKCFPSPSMFVRSPLLCYGIQTKADWQKKLGLTAMDESCKDDLSQLPLCTVCNKDASAEYSKLLHLSNDTSSCFYFVVLYGAGVVNSFGPKNPSTASCLLGLQISTGKKKKTHEILYVCVGVAMVLLVGCVSAVLFYLWLRRRRQRVHTRFVKRNSIVLQGTLHPNTGSVWFKHGDIKTATNNFSDNNLVGRGGFASVYKGTMADGLQIAVKKIRNCTTEGDAEFINEVDVISQMRHRNLVVLRGFCVASNTKDGHQRLLVYDYMCNGSLGDYLFSGQKPPLTWPQRRIIAIGIAKGINYLHNSVQPSIIHRDIKANNVLLDTDLNAKLADFGLAKIRDDGMTHLTTRVAGTQGYLAPEYALYGKVTEKSDVYSFGVLLLVLMSGRPALDTSLESPAHYLITDWAWMMVKEGRLHELIDPRIRYGGTQQIMERFILVGILCAHLMVAFRPTIDQALRMLEGDEDVPEIPDRPLPLTYMPLGDESDTSYGYSSITARGIPFTFNSNDMLR